MVVVTMPHEAKFLSTTPVLASLDIERLVEFFCDKIGFAALPMQQRAYGIAGRMTRLPRRH